MEQSRIIEQNLTHFTCVPKSHFLAIGIKCPSAVISKMNASGNFGRINSFITKRRLTLRARSTDLVKYKSRNLSSHIVYYFADAEFKSKEECIDRLSMWFMRDSSLSRLVDSLMYNRPELFSVAESQAWKEVPLKVKVKQPNFIERLKQWLSEL